MRGFTWGSYAMYFLGGMALVIFGSVMPQLLKHYHVSYTFGGQIVFLNAFGFIIGVPLVSYMMGRFHYKYILSASALAVVVAQMSIFFFPPLGWVCVLAVLNGMGASASETSVASYIMEAFIGRRAIFLGRLEVAFGVGALVMPLIASALIAANAWRFAFLAIGTLAFVLVIVWQSIVFSLKETGTGEQLDAETSAPPEFKTRRTKFVTLSFFLFMTFVYVGLEGCLNGFMPSIFTTYLKSLPYYASLSVSVLWTAMVLGRAAIGWVARRVNYEQYLLWSILGTLAMLIAMSQSRVQWISFMIVFGLGFAMSAIYSIILVYANHTFPGMTDRNESRDSLCGHWGCGIPFYHRVCHGPPKTKPNFMDVRWIYVPSAMRSVHDFRSFAKTEGEGGKQHRAECSRDEPGCVMQMIIAPWAESKAV